MTTPAIQSATIPGLVMWDNGAIVRVHLNEDDTIYRDKQGRVDVRESFGRVELPGLVEDVFKLVEERERKKRYRSEWKPRHVLELLIVRAAKKRAGVP